MIKRFNRWINGQLEASNMTTIYRLRNIEKTSAIPIGVSSRRKEKVSVSLEFVLQFARGLNDWAILPLGKLASPQQIEVNKRKGITDHRN